MKLPDTAADTLQFTKENNSSAKLLHTLYVYGNINSALTGIFAWSVVLCAIHVVPVTGVGGGGERVAAGVHVGVAALVAILVGEEVRVHAQVKVWKERQAWRRAHSKVTT